MHLYEILGWEDGVKVRRKSWREGSYRIFCSTSGLNALDAFASDWELWTEPKKKRKVTLYAPLVKSDSGSIYMCEFGEKKEYHQRVKGRKETVVGWHEIVVEVEE